MHVNLSYGVSPGNNGAASSVARQASSGPGVSTLPHVKSYCMFGSDGNRPDGFWVHHRQRVTPEGVRYTALCGLFMFSFRRERSA